jgi:hypothetical protein
VWVGWVWVGVVGICWVWVGVCVGVGWVGGLGGWVCMGGWVVGGVERVQVATGAMLV